MSIKIVHKLKPIVVNPGAYIGNNVVETTTPPPTPPPVSDEAGYTYIQNEVSPPSSPTSGQTWFARDTGNSFLYYGSVWILTGTNKINGGYASTTF